MSYAYTLAKLIQSQEEGNPYYPLPPDFYDLTHDGRRLARVNACRQWMLHDRSPPEVRGRAFIASTMFFDTYYLRREYDEDNTSILFEPLFYPTEPLPLAKFHFRHMAAIAVYRMLAAVMPRGAGKSTRLGIIAVMQLITHPAFEVLYCTSTNELAEKMGEKLRYQCYMNPRLNDDWGPEYGGELKPGKSEGAQGQSRFGLSNRSIFSATSAQSRQRGSRPRLYLLDDPEYDPRKEVTVEAMRDWMNTLIFDIILPMLQQPGTRCVWTGTFVSPRHYLWHAMQTKETLLPSGVTVQLATEPRFNRWKRMIIPAAEEVDGKLISLWDEMWPTDDETKARLGLPAETPTLHDVEETIGTPAFMKEYLARPGEGGATFFPALTEEYGYTIEQPDDALIDNPYISTSRIRFLTKVAGKSIVREARIADFLRRSFILTIFDTSYTNKAHSDYKACGTFALTPENDLFLLEMWARRCNPEELLDVSFKQADKWFSRVLASEDITAGSAMLDDCERIVESRATEEMGVSHFPNIARLKVGNTPKPTKIASLLWRFTHRKFFLPLFLRGIEPYEMLFRQIEGFNPWSGDDSGGLQNDDCLDICQMTRYVVRGVPAAPPELEAPATLPIVDRILKGERVDSVTGQPLMAQVDVMNTPAHKLFEIIRATAEPARTHRPGLPGGGDF